MIDQLANELIIASGILKTNNVSRIAEEIGYRPLILFNALYRGNETGKFTWDKKKDIITIHDDVATEQLAVTEGIQELTEQLEILFGYINASPIETDMSIEEIMMLLGGTPVLHIKMAVASSDKLTTYELSDPKDKESVYTFVTLKENADKQFGKKQFNVSKSKVSKLAKKNARKAAKQAETAE